MQTVRELVKAEGPHVVNKKDSDDGTALTYAAMSGHVEMISLLIGLGVDLNVQDAISACGSGPSSGKVKRLTVSRELSWHNASSDLSPKHHFDSASQTGISREDAGDVDVDGHQQVDFAKPGDNVDLNIKGVDENNMHGSGDVVVDADAAAGTATSIIEHT